MPPEKAMLTAAVAIGALLVGAGVLALRRQRRGGSPVPPNRDAPRPLGRLTVLHTPPTVPWRDDVGVDRDMSNRDDG